MIVNFRHKGLKRLFEDDVGKGLPPDMLARIEEMLSVVDLARTVDDIALPSYRLHTLKGDLKGFWSITVRANWRIIFRFENGEARDVDLIDYH